MTWKGRVVLLGAAPRSSPSAESLFQARSHGQDDDRRRPRCRGGRGRTRAAVAFGSAVVRILDVRASSGGETQSRTIVVRTARTSVLSDWEAKVNRRDGRPSAGEPSGRTGTFAWSDADRPAAEVEEHRQGRAHVCGLRTEGELDAADSEISGAVPTRGHRSMAGALRVAPHWLRHEGIDVRRAAGKLDPIPLAELGRESRGCAGGRERPLSLECTHCRREPGGVRRMVKWEAPYMS